jgi:hypothetical protein
MNPYFQPPLSPCPNSMLSKPLPRRYFPSLRLPLASSPDLPIISSSPRQHSSSAPQPTRYSYTQDKNPIELT